MTQDTEDVVARVKALLAAANEPRPTPLPEQDSRAGEAMAGVEDQRRYARWADRVADAQRQLTALAPELIADSQSLSDRIDVLREAGAALIADVRARYPGEELRCPHMIALDAALHQEGIATDVGRNPA